MHSAKYAQTHAELARELERKPVFSPPPENSRKANLSASPQGGGGKMVPRRRVMCSEHRLPADYLTAEQVRALDRPGTGAAAPVENAAGPLVKEPYWIE